MTREEFAVAIKATGRTVYRWERDEATPLPVFERAIRDLVAKSTAEAQPAGAGTANRR